MCTCLCYYIGSWGLECIINGLRTSVAELASEPHSMAAEQCRAKLLALALAKLRKRILL